jgi:hypothetical protein
MSSEIVKEAWERYQAQQVLRGANHDQIEACKDAFYIGICEVLREFGNAWAHGGVKDALATLTSATKEIEIFEEDKFMRQGM